MQVEERLQKLEYAFTCLSFPHIIQLECFSRDERRFSKKLQIPVIMGKYSNIDACWRHDLSTLQDCCVDLLWFSNLFYTCHFDSQVAVAIR